MDSAFLSGLIRVCKGGPIKKSISILDGILFSLAFVLITDACYPF